MPLGAFLVPLVVRLLGRRVCFRQPDEVGHPAAPGGGQGADLPGVGRTGEGGRHGLQLRLGVAAQAGDQGVPREQQDGQGQHVDPEGLRPGHRALGGAGGPPEQERRSQCPPQPEAVALGVLEHADARPLVHGVLEDALRLRRGEVVEGREEGAETAQLRRDVHGVHGGGLEGEGAAAGPGGLLEGGQVGVLVGQEDGHAGAVLPVEVPSQLEERPRGPGAEIHDPGAPVPGQGFLQPGQDGMEGPPLAHGEGQAVGEHVPPDPGEPWEIVELEELRAPHGSLRWRRVDGPTVGNLLRW